MINRIKTWFSLRRFRKMNEERIRLYRRAEQDMMVDFYNMMSTKVAPEYFRRREEGDLALALSDDLYPLGIIAAEKYRTNCGTCDVFDPDTVLKFSFLTMPLMCDNSLPENSFEIRACA